MAIRMICTPVPSAGPDLAQPAADGDFDFISYFECADADVPVFRDVCDALRDVTRNPEWAFVREGPVWHGRRTATWTGLFSR